MQPKEEEKKKNKEIDVVLIDQKMGFWCCQFKGNLVHSANYVYC